MVLNFWVAKSCKKNSNYYQINSFQAAEFSLEVQNSKMIMWIYLFSTINLDYIYKLY